MEAGNRTKIIDPLRLLSLLLLSDSEVRFRFLFVVVGAGEMKAAVSLTDTVALPSGIGLLTISVFVLH